MTRTGRRAHYGAGLTRKISPSRPTEGERKLRRVFRSFRELHFTFLDFSMKVIRWSHDASFLTSTRSSALQLHTSSVALFGGVYVGGGVLPLPFRPSHQLPPAGGGFDIPLITHSVRLEDEDPLKPSHHLGGGGGGVLLPGLLLHAASTFCAGAVPPSWVDLRRSRPRNGGGGRGRGTGLLFHDGGRPPSASPQRLGRGQGPPSLRSRWAHRSPHEGPPRAQQQRPLRPRPRGSARALPPQRRPQRRRREQRRAVRSLRWGRGWEGGGERSVPESHLHFLAGERITLLLNHAAATSPPTLLIPYLKETLAFLSCV